MPFDWKAYKDKATKVAQGIRQETNEELANEMSSHARLTNDEIADICPEPADKVAFAALLEAVNSETDRNNKLKSIIENSEEAAKIAVRIIDMVT